ncbi:MAG: M43 family zinc metalloprotease [Bacteroidota bacterium]|nr:M43 family zinc metalloprotease [Bacteroidota bacterium]
MKYLYAKLLLAAIFMLPLAGMAQTTGVQNEKCLAHHMYLEQMANEQAFRTAQQNLEVETQQFVSQYLANKNSGVQKNASVVRVIPVVFHVIHEGGPENISKAQVVDQLDSLNKDFRRLNADAAQTPAPFQALGGDAEIEFRLATLDPQGNCTDGITRTFSPLTNDARNNVKALIYWPSNKYLNIWVVKTIENTSGSSGIILGFAQFPGSAAATDGVVMRSDVIGSIGTAGWNNDGRTASHEVGHWLNLRHIWGDASCGSDFVLDTPTHQAPNTGCPAFPHITCNNGPNGDMFTNYMDYTDGSCQDIFSIGQCARMNAALSSGTSGRNNLWSASNLIATGTTGASTTICTPIAEFVTPVRYICEGTSVNFTDGSWNGTPDTWLWDFPGGTPSSANTPNATTVYNTAGTYDVTLTVTNASGTDTYSQPASIIVVPAIGQYGVPYSESFESITFPGTEWAVENESGNTWVQTANAAYTGTNSVYVNNYTGNTSQTTDVFYTPTYDLSNVTSANMTFWLAFAARSSTSTDQLKVWASTSCGQLWNIRYNKTGTTLSTAGLITSNFVPSAAQWRQETVNIASSSYNNKPNVRFKFDYYQNNGNNIYIDDINLTGTVGLNEVMEAALDFSVYPNPVMSKASIEFTLTDRQAVRIDVLDVMGRVVNQISETTLDAGEYQFELPAELASGVYSVRLNANGYITVRKVIIN